MPFRTYNIKSTEGGKLKRFILLLFQVHDQDKILRYERIKNTN
jgi:hypothetical protein